ncbi:MAG: 50S ribosomal protein L4 [Flavobacteriales bacterium]|nr:50S ribosomal protein L4 [Flavobacteriales bacterium]MDG1781533.1 50S ribosomal protein L4 [Flavobacteriales bacterium]MDG2245314.1 50S ribosomal protein L4 [Flavobacteriales bacterium]
MELTVFNKEGNKTSKKIKLDDSVFAIEPNDHAIYLDVKRYLAAQRQGNHKSKERGEIKGSTRKIKRQKGTGTARAGSIKNPLFRGGGTVFGPRPHKYVLKVNVKVKRLARKSALTYKAQEEGIMFLDSLEMNEAKTQAYLTVLKNLKVDDKKTLVVLPSQSDSIYKSSRNLKGHQVRVAGDLNTYDILNCKNLIFVGNAHEIVQDMLK